MEILTDLAKVAKWRSISYLYIRIMCSDEDRRFNSGEHGANLRHDLRGEMAIDHRKLGQRLRRARETSSLTQDDVANHLRVSRSTVAQIELGNRTVTGIELYRLATLFGKDLQSFLADEEPEEESALVALYRLHPDLSSKEDLGEPLRRCLALGREMTRLEQLLDIDRDLVTVAAYPLPQPRTTWEAIQQGERVALEERGRLGLGLSSISDIAQLLESQDVRTALVTLPDDVSGFTLIKQEIGVLIIANREHHISRRRFSYAHEYCHALIDRVEGGLVSRADDREQLREVRANSFAASFLMPSEAVRQFIHASGKGRPSRMEAEVFDEGTPIRGRARSTAGSQKIQLYDVVRMAQHFGVSRIAACYRLRSTRLLTATELESLLEQERMDKGRKLAQLMGIPEPDHQALRNEFRDRFVGLALEALRRKRISRTELIDLVGMLDVDAREVDEAVSDLDLDDDDSADGYPHWT